jgi:glutamyl-tRNA synthetase
MLAISKPSSRGVGVRGRYAPSPTGELHLGNVRTALVAWLATRAAGGTFVMRVEDLDPPRVIAGAEARALEDLRWLGIDWDEGPDQGGPHAPYRQSERLEYFRDALARLQAKGRLYGCQCSRADLRAVASAPHGEDGPIYPGTCRQLDLNVTLRPQSNLSVRLPAARFVTVGGEWCFNDLVAGPTCQDVENSVGDFVVRRADGLFAYQLAVVVDDGLMGINQVVRGADLLGSTGRQLQLQSALSIDVPTYAHVPLVLDAQGNRLAKRDLATGIRDLRAAGVPATRVVGLMAWSLGFIDDPAALTATELIGEFAWDKLNQEAWRCTQRDLDWLHEV